MAWALIIPTGSLLGSSLDWALEGGGKGGGGGVGEFHIKMLFEKLEWDPLRETYPNTQISFSREYNGAHKLTYKEHECQTSKLWVQPWQFNNFVSKSKKKKIKQRQ